MIRLLYSLLLALLSPILLYGLFKKKKNKPVFGSRWREHFGITTNIESKGRPIWVHAVSVGEVIAATPIIREIKERYPQHPILVTTTTSTGAEQASKLDDVAEHRYMPIDFSIFVASFLKKTNPKCLVIMETELWPNTLHTVAKFGIPISVLNARLSEKSLLSYKKVQWLFNLMEKSLSRVCCQNSDDASRFIELGVDAEKITVTGSVKFDVDIPTNITEYSQTLREQLDGNERQIWIAASTHQGEDEQILDVHHQLLKSHPNLLLILVPRHPERFSKVTELASSRGFTTVTRTSKEIVSLETQIYIGDTMGEMLALIGASDICVMCGSFIGNKVGGHNILEPAALGIPTITGPSYFNFQFIVDQLNELNGCGVVDDQNMLMSELDRLLRDKSVQTRIGANARNFIDDNRGAIDRTIQCINEDLVE